MVLAADLEGLDRVCIRRVVNQQVDVAAISFGRPNTEFQACAAAAIFPEEAEGVCACGGNVDGNIFFAAAGAVMSASRPTANISLGQHQACLASRIAKRNADALEVITGAMDDVISWSGEDEPGGN